MKSLFFLLACVISVSYQMTMKETHPDFFAKVQKFTDECIRESHADKDEVEDLLNKGEFPNKQELKCFMRCIFEKTDIINDDGDIEKSGIEASLPDDTDSKEAEEIIENCLKAKVTDPCETAYRLTKCCEEKFD